MHCTFIIKHIQYTNVSQAGGVEAEYPNSFGYNPRPSPASMTSFGLKTQIISAINRFSWVPYLGAFLSKMWFPPPKKKVQAFNCPRVFFSLNFNKSSPNILSLQETLIKTMDKVSRNNPRVVSYFYDNKKNIADNDYAITPWGTALLLIVSYYIENENLC